MKYDIDIDMEEFHGLNVPVNENKLSHSDSVRNPYEAPDIGISGIDYQNTEIQFGFWIWFFCIVNIAWSALLIWITFAAINENELIVSSILWQTLVGISIYQIVAYLGLITKQNWARVLVLIISYIKLVFVPIGTIEGVIFIRRLKGRHF